MKTLTKSVLTKNQNKTYGPRPVSGYGHGAQITATVRYDDRCGNGHNTFSITADVVTPASKRMGDIEAGGCLHDEIAQVFPELAPFIKWHLCSSDGPMHYVANTVYHALSHGPKMAWVEWADPERGISGHVVKYCTIEQAEALCQTPGYSMRIDEKTSKVANLDYARSSAVWPGATDDELLAPDLAERLQERLPAILVAFQEAVESLGFTY